MKPLSASQYERYACLRRGQLEYVHGFKRPMSGSHAIGTRVHELAEAYLLTGQEPDLNEVMTVEGKTYFPGQILWPGLELGPAPRSVLVEGEIKFSTPSSPWTGRYDALLNTEDRAVIYDWKTTKDFKYAKTTEQLEADVAANLYAFDVFERRLELDSIDAHWVYMRVTGRPKSRLTAAILPRSQVYDIVLGTIDPRAAMIQSLKACKTPAADVLYDRRYCDDYGGCPHKNKGCKIPVAEMFRPVEVSVSSILERLRANKNKIDEKYSALHEPETGAALIMAMQDCPTPVEPEERGAAPTGQEEHGTINCPERLAETPAELGAQSMGYGREKEELLADLDALDRDALKGLAVKHGLVTTGYRGQKPALIGLLRAYGHGTAKPSSETTTPERECLDEPASPEEMDNRRQKAKVFLSQVSEAEPAIGVLYIGCLPLTPVTDVQKLVQYVLPRVLESVGEPHVKLVQYGKGPAMLAAAVEEHLKQSPVEALFADKYTDQELLSTLVRLAAQTVRGL